MDSRLLESTVNPTQTAWVADAEGVAPIPTCPGWTLTALVGHVGATQRWVSRLVGEGISDPGTAFSVGWESAPATQRPGAPGGGDADVTIHGPAPELLEMSAVSGRSTLPNPARSSVIAMS